LPEEELSEELVVSTFSAVIPLSRKDGEGLVRLRA
jgi:hypothetical protein